MGKYPSNWDRLRRVVLKRDNYRCQKCGAAGKSSSGVELHAHHIVPLSEGGLNKSSNLMTVCKNCHESIHGHPVGGSVDSQNETAQGSPIVAIIILAIICIKAWIAVVVFVLWLAANRYYLSSRNLTGWKEKINWCIPAWAMLIAVLQIGHWLAGNFDPMWVFPAIVFPFIGSLLLMWKL